jgi:hypothetical protein
LTIATRGAPATSVGETAAADDAMATVRKYDGLTARTIAPGASLGDSAGHRRGRT